MKEDFIMIPNNAVWGKEEVLIKKYGEKISYILSYLDSKTDRENRSGLSISDLITRCGMKITTGKDGSVEQFRKLLIKLQADGIITDANVDLDKAKVKDYINCIFTMPLEQKDGKNINFFMVSRKDYFKAIYSENKCSKCDLLNTYYYIMARMNIKLGYFYDKQEKIATELGLSKTTLNKYIEELKALGIVYSGNIGVVDGKKANNIYSDSKEGLEKGLKESSKYYGVEYKAVNESSDVANEKEAKLESDNQSRLLNDSISKTQSEPNNCQKIYSDLEKITGEKLSKSEKGELDKLSKENGQDVIERTIKRKSDEIRIALDKKKDLRSKNRYSIGIMKKYIDETKGVIAHEEGSAIRMSSAFSNSDCRSYEEKIEEYKVIQAGKRKKEKESSKVVKMVEEAFQNPQLSEEEKKMEELLAEFNEL